MIHCNNKMNHWSFFRERALEYSNKRNKVTSQGIFMTSLNSFPWTIRTFRTSEYLNKTSIILYVNRKGHDKALSTFSNRYEEEEEDLEESSILIV